jgi:hypothetical protein
MQRRAHAPSHPHTGGTKPSPVLLSRVAGAKRAKLQQADGAEPMAVDDAAQQQDTAAVAAEAATPPMRVLMSQYYSEWLLLLRLCRVGSCWCCSRQRCCRCRNSTAVCSSHCGVRACARVRVCVAAGRLFPTQQLFRWLCYGNGEPGVDRRLRGGALLGWLRGGTVAGPWAHTTRRRRRRARQQRCLPLAPPAALPLSLSRADGSHAAADSSFPGRRELCFTLEGDIFVRYQSYKVAARARAAGQPG